MDLFIKIDTGTDYQNRWIINPLFILLAESAMNNIRTVAKLFGLTFQYKK